jgi:esterase/lipase superfamily enzyme
MRAGFPVATKGFVIDLPGGLFDAANGSQAYITRKAIRRMRPGWRFWIVMLAAMALLVGCAEPIKLAPAPTLYRVGAPFPASDVPPAFRTIDPQILYLTDRQPEMTEGRLTGYSYARSESMVLGRAQVRFGDLDDWPALVARSQSEATRSQTLVTDGFTELVRFPATPLPVVEIGSSIVTDPVAARDYAQRMTEMQQAVAAQLRLSPRKEVIIYVHGFNNRLEDGLTTTASLWHYAGRIGVPISYSWPAGNPGLTAYFKDGESGDFSTYHFKEFLRAIAAMPEVERIKIVAHSRGADLVMTGLREMVIFERGAGRDARQSLKIDTLILAAPDLDFGVVQQRLVAEDTVASVRTVTVYLNPRDGALGFAQLLVSGQRVGRLSPGDFTEEEWRRMGVLGNVNFVDVEAAGGRLGHGYFRDNPAVLSDIILILRTGALPGSAERPLERVRGNFWSLHDNYPGPRIIREIKRGEDR